MGSAPPLAKRDQGGRFYNWKDEKFPSVTTIIGALNKPALLGWAAKLSAEAAWKDVTSSDEPLSPAAHDESVRLWAKAPFDVRNESARLGSKVHDYVEQTIAGLEPEADQELSGFAKSFAQFMDDYDPRFSHSECTVLNRTHAYAGTMDGVAEIGEDKVIIDVKSGNGIYGSTALQLAAYRHGEFIAHPDGVDELVMPEVTRGAILHLRPSGYRLVEVDVRPHVFRNFLYLAQVYAWSLTERKMLLHDFPGRKTEAPLL